MQKVLVMYAEDHGGKFWNMMCPDAARHPSTEIKGGHFFIEHCLRYFQADFKVITCPMANKTEGEGADPFSPWCAYDSRGGSYTGFGLGHVEDKLGLNFSDAIAKGSYCMNLWFRNPKRSEIASWIADYPWTIGAFYRGPNIKNASEVPLIGDGRAGGANAIYANEVPEYDGAWATPMSFPICEMSRFVVNRHNAATLMGFTDMSVRRVGLKELWDLQWHRGHYYVDVDDGRTPDHVPKADLSGDLGWFEQEHWMNDMKEYSPWLPLTDPRRLK